MKDKNVNQNLAEVVVNLAEVKRMHFLGSTIYKDIKAVTSLFFDHLLNNEVT